MRKNNINLQFILHIIIIFLYTVLLINSIIGYFIVKYMNIDLFKEGIIINKNQLRVTINNVFFLIK